MRRMAVAIVASAGLATACSASFAVLFPGDDGAPQADGGRPLGDGGTREEYCKGSGPPVVVGDHVGVPTCPGKLAEATFRYALCTCEGFVSNSPLTTDSFDSTQGAYDPAKAMAGGGVGTNGNFNATGVVSIGGSFWASDTTGVTLAARTEAKGEFHAAGRVQSGDPFAIGKDAYCAADVVARTDLTIGGTLHIAPGKTATAGGTKTIAATVSEPVSVGPACDCAPEQLLDVAGLVADFATANDDAAVGIDPHALENVTTATTLDVPCGRVYFTRVGGSAATTLRVNGRAAIFVGGDLAANGAFTVDVAPGSEVDLFVGGNVVAGDAFTLGSAANPAAARLYTGGTGTIDLTRAATLAGNVYAPRAELVLGASTTVFGSIFVRRVSTQGALTIHYDQSVLSRGGSCDAPAGCATCRDCGGQACKAGACTTCATNADCCAPLLCTGGQCTADVR